MHRFHVATLERNTAQVTLTDDNARHAWVRRLAVGEAIELFDGCGLVLSAVVVQCTPERTECRVVEVRTPFENLPRIVLVLGIPKHDKLDLIVRMSTELGVHRICLANTERTVAKMSGATLTTKLERLGRLARSAAVQCGRAVLPTIEAPGALVEIAQGAPAGALKLVCWEESQRPLAQEVCRGLADIWVVVGPEGGFSRAEVDALRRLGYGDVSLGDLRLRVETAVPAALAAVKTLSG